MVEFVDVLLRALTLVFASLAAGGVAWVGLVLRAEPRVKPDDATRDALRVVCGSGWLAAASQATALALTLRALAQDPGPWPLASYFGATSAHVALGRTLLGIVVGVLAGTLARRPARRALWVVLFVSAGALVAVGAGLSHAVARLDHRLLLLILDGGHQLVVAIWVGGLAQLALYAMRRRLDPDPREGLIVRRFSTVALGAVMALAATGVGLSVAYVGAVGALIGTAYGIMVLTKVVFFAGALGLAVANFRAVRLGTTSASAPRLSRFVEVELGLAVTVVFAAVSLTSLPPATDVREARATAAEVGARLAPSLPRFGSPPIDELLRTADPLLGLPGERKPVERAWSEYNHHWAGVFVLIMGMLAVLEQMGVRAARHWPLVFLGLAVFLFGRNDPRAWPLGPVGFWESLVLPDVLQHRTFLLFVVAFGIFEWLVRTGRLAREPWGCVLPLLCAVGGALLLTHSHAMVNLKDEFLTEIAHVPIAILGAFAGWARWLEVRLPTPGRAPGWVWAGCLLGVGGFLLFYREA